MMSNHNSSRGHPTPDTLFDLAAGLVPTDEQAVLLDHLGDCPPCEEEFVQASADLETGRAARPDDATVNQALRAIPLPQQSRRPIWHTLVPVAAAAVLAIALLLPPSSDGDGSRMIPLPSPGAELRLRDVGIKADELLTTGLAAYDQGDWNEATRLLEQADTEGAWAPVRSVYLGSALAFSDRLGEARTLLEQIEAHILPDPWGSESRWPLSAVYRKLGETARADSLIAILAEESGSVGDRARELIADQD